MILPGASSATGLPSTEGPGTSTSTSENVVYLEVNAARPLPIRSTKTLDSILRRHESNPQRAAKLAAARRRLAPVLRGDGTLADLRLQAGLSQHQLAIKARTSQPHVARIESGKNDPTTDLIARLSAALGTDEEATYRAVRKSRSAQNE